MGKGLRWWENCKASAKVVGEGSLVTDIWYHLAVGSVAALSPHTSEPSGSLLCYVASSIPWYIHLTGFDELYFILEETVSLRF